MARQPQPNANRSVSWGAVLIAVVIGAAVALVFGQTLRHGFINFDDGAYVYQNPEVNAGLTGHGIWWALTQPHARNWHPLTTLSHMLDCELFGLNPGGHHLTNVILHASTAVLLFCVLRRMTKTLWQSAFVAAVFAIHPLRVESVAWVAERKDVLSGLFFVLTLGAYSRYARVLTVRSYALVVVAFAAGLMSKPMLVTLPIILLLLDWWPLRRFQASASTPDPKHSLATAKRLLLEKCPLFFLSALSCLATVAAQSGSVGALEPFPLLWRFENAMISVVVYLVQIVWPVGLTPFYPFDIANLSPVETLGCALLLVGITAGCLWLRHSQPWLLVGWTWYLVMLLPVIGIVQIGMQAHADRYTYLPQVGVCVAATWGIAEATKALPRRSALLATAAAAFLIAMGILAWMQTRYWRDSWTLWTHASAVTQNNEVAENNLGTLLDADGKYAAAIQHFQRAIAIQKQRGQARYMLTIALAENNLGNALARTGESDDAIAHYRVATELRPDYADAFYNLGVLQQQQHHNTDAISAFEKALKLRPDDAAAHGRLGDALRSKSDERSALRHYERAAELAPDATWAQYSLAWLLATSPDPSLRDGKRALSVIRRAMQLPNAGSGAMFRALAAAHADLGDFSAAISAAEQGMRTAVVQGDVETVHQLQGDVELYRSGFPLRELMPTH